MPWRQSRPFRLKICADNSGTKETGQYQGSVTVSLDNPLGRNDLVYLSLNHDLGGGMLGGHTARTATPRTTKCPGRGYWLLGVTRSQYNYYQSIACATSAIV